MIYKSKKFETK